MPSLETIRTITVRGKVDGVDQATAALNRLTEQLQATNQNMLRMNQVANDNERWFNITSEGALKAANHMREAALAAWTLSPAFASVVKEMRADALRAAGPALTTVAAGMVTATHAAGTGLITLADAAERTSPALSGVASGMRSAGASLEAFSPTVLGTVGTSLGYIGTQIMRLMPLVGRVMLIYDAVKMVGEAWRLGGERIAEYIDLAEKASASGVSTEFFQRMKKAAEEVKMPVEELARLFDRLNEAAKPVLGGTAAQNRLTELIDAGNFGGNAGVGELRNATSNEDRLRAMKDLWDQALQKGERLAALDIAKAFGGEELTGHLAKDSGYLDDMIRKADAIKQDDLVSQKSIDNAQDLQYRLDAAEKILSQRWHPIQEILVELGLKMRETWVDIVETIAKAVNFVTWLGEKIVENLKPVLDMLRQAGEFIDRYAPSLANAARGMINGPNGPTDPMTDARARLAARLQSPDAMSAARGQMEEAYNRVHRVDTSHAPDKHMEETISAYERASDAVEKYIKMTDAATASVGKGVAEQERLKVIAQLTAAAMKDGTEVTAEMRAEMDRMAERAAAAALALERAKVAADIKFNSSTSLLSSEDVQIAQQLKGLYPDVATALNSVEAQAMRTNNAMKEMAQALESNLTSSFTDMVSGSKSASQAFQDMSQAIIKAIEQMIIKITIVEPLMRSLQMAMGGGSGLAGLLGLGGGASAGAPLSLSPINTSMVGIYHTGGLIGEQGMSSRYVHPTYFDDAMRFHTGGIAGHEVPIIAQRGEGVFTPAQMAAIGKGLSASARTAPNVTVNVHNAPAGVQSTTTSADANGNVQLDVILKKMVDQTVGDSLSMGTGQRILQRQYGVKQFMGR